MTRSDLVTRLSQRIRTLSAEQFDRIVSAILDAISQQLAAGGRVELRGFGAFSTRLRTARPGVNPRTGERVAVGAKRLVYFRPGKETREMLSGGNGRNQCHFTNTLEP